MKKKLILLVSLLLYLCLGGCSDLGLLEQPGTEGAVAEPHSAGEPGAVPEPFSLDAFPRKRFLGNNPKL